MNATELLTVISEIKDACDAAERMEITPDQAVTTITRIVAPVDTSEVE